MVREDPKKIQEQVQKQDDEFYGEEAVGGHAAGLETDDNAADPLAKYLGRKPSEILDIAEDIDDQEKNLHSLLVGDDDSEEQDEDDENLDDL